MSRIDSAVPPSETVLWRWPAPRRMTETLGWFTFYAVGAVAGWAVWTDVIEDKVWSGIVMTLATTSLAGLGGKVLGVLAALLWGRRTVAVTGQRVVAATGGIVARTDTVYREAIRSASLYEGDDTLVLHGREQELLRLPRMETETAAEFLALLDVPTAVWRKRDLSGPVRAIRKRVLAGTLIFWAVLGGAAVALIGPRDIGLAAVSGFAELSALVTLPGAVVLALIGGGAALFALAVAQAMLHDYAAVALARYRAPPEVLRELICAAGDPLWRGWPRDPEKAAKVSDIFESLDGWARYLGAAPVAPIPLEPECRDFSTETESAEEAG